MARTLLSLWGLSNSLPKSTDGPVEETDINASDLKKTDENPASKEVPKVHPFFAKRVRKAPEQKNESTRSVVNEKVHDCQENKHSSQEKEKINANPETDRMVNSNSPSQFVVTLRVDSDKLKKVSSSPPSKPSFMVTLKADPGRMLEIKPRVHSFFAKRPRVQKKEISSWKPSPKLCPWPRTHIRSARDSLVEKLPRRQARILEKEHWDLKISRISGKRYVKTPRRLAVDSQEISAWLVNSSPENSDTLIDSLKNLSQVPKPFDCGMFEEQLWIKKYSPQTCQQHIDPVNCLRISNWMQKRLSKGNTVHPICLLIGPSGVGKTSAVFAAAKEQDCFVLEVNATMKRSGRDLSSMLDGVGHSHAVHSNRLCVLVEEADAILESEGSSFWANLEKFAYNTNRPVIVTSETASRIPLFLDIKCIEMCLAPPARLVDVAWLIALSEGHIIDKKVLADAALRGAPLRDILMHIQFWCQWGIGGSLSGAEWYRREGEPSRIFSVDTWVAPWRQPEYYSKSQGCTDLNEFLTAAEDTSAMDREVTTVEPSLPASENLWSLQPLSNYSEPVMVPPKGSRDAVEVTPFIREMARADLVRRRIMEQHHVGRMTRRAWSTLGIDARQYLSPEYAMAILNAWGNLA